LGSLHEREKNGLLSISKEANRRRLFLDCSTIDTATCKKVEAVVDESGLGGFADAPVSVSPFTSSESILSCDRVDPTEP
jgi:3-hydroxyisobutyrate dehydrogenase-like beta-hydroxyacid dehydrogenase